MNPWARIRFQLWLQNSSFRFQLWWWHNVTRYTNPMMYRAVHDSISTLSTMVPPSTHREIMEWVVKSKDTYITHYAAAYLTLCEAAGKDITKYHGTKWKTAPHGELAY